MNIYDQFDSAGNGGANLFDQFDAKKKDPRIGQPEELTLGEKIASALESPLEFAKSMGVSRGGAVGRLAMGAADPGVAIAQIAANLTGNGDGANQRIQDVEKEYQDARKAEGSTGFDPLRVAGNVAITAPAGVIGGGAKTLLGRVAGGMATGGTFGALQPVTEGDFATEKAKQVGTGVVAGGLLTPLAGALARIISPNASVNPSLNLLRKEGVETSIGQTLGGAFNTAEEKAMSLPIVGDLIRNARGRALEGFNEAALNRVVDPLDGKVTGAGFEAYGRAKQAVSGAYDDALNSISHVNFATPSMVQKLGELEGMASQLPDPLAQQFRNLLDTNVAKRISPNGSMLPDFYKKLDSELGQKAAQYGRSAVSSEQDFGAAVRSLQQLFRDEVATQNPQFAHALRAADAAYANSIPVRDAVGRAVNNNGVFTPGQLNYAIRKTQGAKATTGDARLQDLARAAQDVIGNKVPNSGTVDRGALVAAALNPWAYAPAAVGGALAYTRPVQNALRAIVASRPEQAPAVANALRRYLPRLAPAEVAALEHRDR